MYSLAVMNTELKILTTLMDDLDNPELCEERKRTLNAFVELSLLLKEFPHIAMMHNSPQYPREREQYLALRMKIPAEFTNHFLRQVAYREFEVF